jgi:hypothetical protein
VGCLAEAQEDGPLVGVEDQDADDPVAPTVEQAAVVVDLAEDNMR